jgi:hypothetical protein
MKNPPRVKPKGAKWKGSWLRCGGPAIVVLDLSSLDFLNYDITDSDKYLATTDAVR